MYSCHSKSVIEFSGHFDHWYKFAKQITQQKHNFHPDLYNIAFCCENWNVYGGKYNLSSPNLWACDFWC